VVFTFFLDEDALAISDGKDCHTISKAMDSLGAGQHAHPGANALTLIPYSASPVLACLTKLTTAALHPVYADAHYASLKNAPTLSVTTTRDCILSTFPPFLQRHTKNLKATRGVL
jgi:hypothetical protein